MTTQTKLEFSRAVVDRTDKGSGRKTWTSRCGRYAVVFADRIYGSAVPPPHWKVMTIGNVPFASEPSWVILSRHSTRAAAEAACRKHAKGK